MNGRIIKKIRKYSKRNWMEYVAQVKQWPFMARLRFAWYIIKPNRKKEKHGDSKGIHQVRYS